MTAAATIRRAALSSVCGWPRCYQLIHEGTKITRVNGRGWCHDSHLTASRKPQDNRGILHAALTAIDTTIRERPCD